ALKVLAAGMTLQEKVFCHESAAVLLGLPFNIDEGEIHVLVQESKNSRVKTSGVKFHTTQRKITTVESFGALATDISETSIALAKKYRTAEAVAVFDFAQATGEVSKSSLVDDLEIQLDLRGKRAARIALDLSSPYSESIGESYSRMTILALGFPAPQLQKEFFTDTGDYRVDFWWPEYDVVGEFDGKVKYQKSAEFWHYADRDAENSAVDNPLYREKIREDSIRRETAAFVRWGMKDLRSPKNLLRILGDAGLPRINTINPNLLPTLSLTSLPLQRVGSLQKG
ncbi:MAG: hypothetical protein KF916_06860, partial [Microbacteriaceae bacterium]|nr:hypothetical protein [Microbacteriaceae bacterium]